MSFPLIYHSKPAFGLDIGRSTIKVVQLERQRHGYRALGYGYGHFDPMATEDGIIVKPDLIAEALQKLFKHSLVGRITTKRAVASLPIAHIYTRILQLPTLSRADLKEAVTAEAQQYVPLPVDEIYVEYKLLPRSESKSAQKTEDLQPVLMVATPKRIVNSYLQLFQTLELEVDIIEPNMFANLRSVNFNYPAAGSRIVIDFGAQSSDLAIYDQTPQLVSTVATGGERINQIITGALKLTPDQANQLKIRYGIGKSRWQTQLATALEPILSDFANEVQKLMRYYHEHHPRQHSIDQVALVGGGANMPGLADFLSHLTGVEVVIVDPWQKVIISPLQPPAPTETTIYATVMGLALKGVGND